MDSSSSSSSDSNVRIDLLDLERRSYTRDEKQPQGLIRVWKLPVPLRKNHLVSDITKNVTVLLTAVCITQAIWIQHLQAGLERIPNDPYDDTFYDVNRNSPSVWDDDRQSFIHSAMPVPVHSHNDYWRRIPLFEALGSGCISVEADVHLRDSDLLVGHSAKGLHKDLTLRSMYLEPLQRMIQRQNTGAPDGLWRGIFDQSPQQTMVLLIDHKTAGAETFAELHTQLQPLRALDYLTYWNGTNRVIRPLTIIASGNAPFDSVKALDPLHRDIFWDAQLDKLVSTDDDWTCEPPIYAYNQSNSYYASTEFHKAILWHWQNPALPLPSTPAEKDAALRQIDQANARGLISRYWDLPAHPPNLREIVWRVLVAAQIGVLNMDDLGTVRARAYGWGKL